MGRGHVEEIDHRVFQFDCVIKNCLNHRLKEILHSVYISCPITGVRG